MAEAPQGTTCGRWLFRTFAGAPKTFHLEFSARSTGAIDRVFTFGAFRSNDYGNEIAFLSTTTGLVLRVSNYAAQQDFPVGGFAALAWHRVVLDVDIVARTITLVVDGFTQLTNQPYGSAYRFGGTAFEIRAGLLSTVSGDPLALAIDDVRFTYQL